MKYAAEFDVRFGDIDHARVVYYPRFYHYFHQAFERWFGEALGVSYAELITVQNIGFPVVKIETEFHAPLRYGDRMRIELEIAEIGSRSITMRYSVIRLGDQKVATRATIKTVAIDNDTFKSLTIPDEWRERFEKYRAAQSS